MRNAPPTVILTNPERATLAEVRLLARGIYRAADLLGVSRDTYERAAGGLPIRRGSAALIRIALANLGTPNRGIADAQAHPIGS